MRHPHPRLQTQRDEPRCSPRSIRWTARLSGPVCRSIVIRNGSGFSIRSNVPCRKTNRSISFATTTPRTNIRSRQLVEAQHALSCALHTDQCILAEHGRTLLPGSFRNNGFGAGVFHSVPELIQAVEEYVGGHNQNPKPFIWTATASDILEKVQRARKKLDKLQSV